MNQGLGDSGVQGFVDSGGGVDLIVTGGLLWGHEFFWLCFWHYAVGG